MFKYNSCSIFGIRNFLCCIISSPSRRRISPPTIRIRNYCLFSYKCSLPDDMLDFIFPLYVVEKSRLIFLEAEISPLHIDLCNTFAFRLALIIEVYLAIIPFGRNDEGWALLLNPYSALCLRKPYPKAVILSEAVAKSKNLGTGVLFSSYASRVFKVFISVVFNFFTLQAILFIHNATRSFDYAQDDGGMGSEASCKAPLWSSCFNPHPIKKYFK